jgi:hypothetical protein
MTSFEDNVSRLVLSFIDILLLKNPERTILGTFLGLVFAFLVRLFGPAIKRIEFIDPSAAPIWGWIPLGIILIHLPMVIWDIFHRPEINDEIDGIIKFIEKGQFSEIEKRLIYRNLVNQCVKNMTLRKDFSDTMARLQENASEDI